MGTTPDDLINNSLMGDSDYYHELGYCITPEEHIKEVNGELLRLRSINQELLDACEELVRVMPYIRPIPIGYKNAWAKLHQAISKAKGK